MSTCPLPIWIQWLQALAVPVIAGVGAWIALQQMYLAKVKLQHDTYDRKFAVFVAVHSLLNVISALKRAPHLDEMGDFINTIGAAPFLFDNSLADYVKEIQTRVLRAHGLDQIMLNLEEHDRRNALEELSTHISWLDRQSDIIVNKFRPALELRKRHPLSSGW
jgi:hypothetical protein